MANSLITRCPKCSTAFRVTDDILAMAQGKVRCGQCFHIFDTANVAPQAAQKNQAEPASANTLKSQASTNATPTPKISSNENRPEKPTSSENQEPKKQVEPSLDSDSAADEEIINPDWLETLFDDEDLQPFEEKPTPKSIANKKGASKTQAPKKTDEAQNDHLAPWELELAEVEAALKNAPTPQSDNPENQVIKATNNANKPIQKIASQKQPEHTTGSIQEPDYMVALHSLAQTASAQSRPSNIRSQHSILERLSAQESLAPLLEENETKPSVRKKRTWLWLLGLVLGGALLTGQVAAHYFDTGSRSPSLRSFYKMACSYLDCALPSFEDIDSISIQHVRIQSHPSIPNTLLVNAIMTNVSSFSQSMPKIALEFFDLNGTPVAARLFAPRDYLHKDFLDITYMPSNTPIHLVIPIKDPGATAVTHQLNVFSADTRSY